MKEMVLSKKIIFSALIIAPNTHAMLRLANINPSLKQRAAQAIRARQAATIHQCIQNVLRDPNYIEKNWVQTKSIALNTVAQQYNVLDPAQVPAAVDTAKVVLHHFAPGSQKDSYLLTDSCLDCQKCALPYACTVTMHQPPSDHSTRLYCQALKLGLWRKSDPHYVRRAPYVHEHFNKQIMHAAAQNICGHGCPACKIGKSEVGLALRQFVARVENDAYKAQAASLGAHIAKPESLL